MKIIRIILTLFLLFFDVITRPRKMKRSEVEQAKVDEQTKHLTLYQFKACPFCIKVRRMIHKLNLKIEYKDALQKNVEAELIQGGGKRKVPCLRIEENAQVQWMYESSDINEYLQKRFA